MKEITERKAKNSDELTCKQEDSSTDNHILNADISDKKTVLKSESFSGFAVPAATVRPAKPTTKITGQSKGGDKDQKSKTTTIHSEREVKIELAQSKNVKRIDIPKDNTTVIVFTLFYEYTVIKGPFVVKEKLAIQYRRYVIVIPKFHHYCPRASPV